ncbi:MAG: S1 family peptidase, partial [Actinobacteria bacterium]|nr:S1 family peptidase [Actinomycetota bacterium]
MRLKRTFLTTAVLSGLALTLGVVPAQSQPAKSDARAKQGPADERFLRAEAAAAGQSAARANPGASRALAAVQARIADHARANGNRQSFASFLDPATGKIVIETDAPADEVAKLAGAEAGLVEVRPGAVTDAYSRKSDVAPFWGGAGVTLTKGTPWCSTGFTVKKSTGVRFMTTAGHCFSNGANVVTENGGVAMGTVSDRGPLPPYDMELIGGKSYGASIYLGGVDSSSSGPVVAAADPVVNFNGYCHSGRTTGEQCGHTVTSVTAQVCTQTGCKSPVIAFTGGVLPQGGDSGSPFYYKSGTNIHIRGLI